MKPLIAKFTSRKFLLTLASSVGTLVAVQLGLDPELAAKLITGLIGLYVGTEGAGDFAARLNTNKTES